MVFQALTKPSLPKLLPLAERLPSSLSLLQVWPPSGEAKLKNLLGFSFKWQLSMPQYKFIVILRHLAEHIAINFFTDNFESQSTVNIRVICY